MPGPPPNPNAIRQNARVGPLILPAAGRVGKPPAWPLPVKQDQFIKETWAMLWSTPQAAAWETLGEGTVRVVARYTVLLGHAENMSPVHMAEARQIEDRLGLNPKAMRTLMWTISRDEVAEKRATEPAKAAADAVRARIKAVG